MWRRCDLHNHTPPNEQLPNATWNPDSYVAACVAAGLDVVAITDHNHINHIDDLIVAADGTGLHIVPGVELSTDRGHLLVLSPGEGGDTTIREFVDRVGATQEDQVNLDAVFDAVVSKRTNGEPFIEGLLLIGAHVDAEGSLLATGASLSLKAQIEAAKKLQAIEVVDDERLEEWQRLGVKQSNHPFALIRGSDTHDSNQRRDVSTWIYLPDVTVADFRHAFAVQEASVSVGADRPTTPDHIIESISFVDGHHNGAVFTFSERTNAIIGPPNSGKSLIVDALKFVFGVECDIEQVESVTQLRMAARMPAGSTVRVVLRTPDGRSSLERTVGGASVPTPPFVPIIFSQTELTRRGIADQPAIQLLDLHSEDIEARIAAIRGAADTVSDLFEALLDLAHEGKDLREKVYNAEDGLTATEKALKELTGTEAAADMATDAEKVAIWRAEALESIELWEADYQLSRPRFPKAPDIRTTDPDLRQFAPAKSLEAAAKDSTNAAKEAVADAARSMRATLRRTDAAFIKMDRKVSEDLTAAGFETGHEFADELKKLRVRAADLSTKQKKVKQLQRTITSDLKKLKVAVAEVYEARRELSRARTKACRAVNKTMRSFRAKIDPEGETSILDELFDGLKIGTRLRSDTRRKSIEKLDRFRLLEVAVRLTQDLAVAEDPDLVPQDRVVNEALERGKLDELLSLACLWPGDALDLGWKDTSPVTPFSGLTEGLRALAVKEISFAASYLPVITDQPEDAVPTRSVFETLVPTLREQRVDRQFIVVSHDANIVVTGDVDLVAVLDANKDGSAYVGSLFDNQIRDAALEHLEGGRSAFALRAARYAEFGTL